MAKATKALPTAKKKPTPAEIQALLQDTRTLLTHWTRIRDFISLALGSEPITREHEQGFLELKSETARDQRVVAQKIPEDLRFGADKITDFLRQAISAAHLRGLPAADKRGLVSAWHVASVMLHRAVGALEYIGATQHIVKHKKAAAHGIWAIKQQAAGGRKRSKAPLIIGAVIIIAAAAAAAYFLLLGA